MFLVSEVHPFADGNGRFARIMANAELVAAGVERILIPTVYRANYLSALKGLSQAQNPEPLVRTLDFAQRWVAGTRWADLDSKRIALERNHAFMDAKTGRAEERRVGKECVSKGRSRWWQSN